MFSRIILPVRLVFDHFIALTILFALPLPSPSASPLLRQVESDSARRKRKRLELEAQHTAKLRDLLAQSLIGEGGTVCRIAWWDISRNVFHSALPFLPFLYI